MATKKKQYPIEMVTYHSVTIRWDFKDVPGADYDYREKFERRVSAASHRVCEEFGVSQKTRQFYPIGHFHYKRIIIAGEDKELARQAGEALAKVIFSHRYVVPANHTNENF